MSGWIKVHRSVLNHWVFDDERYFKAWITMILKANHEPKKVLIHGELIECNRGQSILSLSSWAKSFGKKWSIQKVRTFFELLEKDQMILVEGLRKTTRLTICNYDDYQDVQQADSKQTTDKEHVVNTQVTDRQQQTRTTKNYKNEKKNTMSPNGDGLFPFENSILEIIRSLKSENLNREIKPYKISPKRIKMISARQKDFNKLWPGRDFYKACRFAFAYKAKEWFGSDMFRFFEPETLLTEKFSSYLEVAEQNKGEPSNATPKIETKPEQIPYRIPI